jgi:hypothetical protein
LAIQQSAGRRRSPGWKRTVSDLLEFPDFLVISTNLAFFQMTPFPLLPPQEIGPEGLRPSQRALARSGGKVLPSSIAAFGQILSLLFTHLKKKSVYCFMHFDMPEAQGSRKIVLFSRQILYVLQEVFRGLLELLRAQISNR